MSGPHALMWSGGKDSALALHRAAALGIEVVRLLSFFDSTSGRVRFHATRTEMLQAQAAAAGLELRAVGTTWREMDVALRAELAALKSEGFAGVVLGDIHLADVRAWYEDRVAASGLAHVEPLWGDPPAALVREYVVTGGRAVVTCIDESKLDRSWLGRTIDERFVEDVIGSGIDPCGENGEYHSFAFEGPDFASPVQWFAGEVRREGGFRQLDLLPAERRVT